MKTCKSIIAFVVFITILSCQGTNKDTAQIHLPDKDSIEEWLLGEKIDEFGNKLMQTDLDAETGLSKIDYLEVIEGQVRAMQRYQDSSGRIIDPVENEEKYYTTPCYAHSISVLALSGYTIDAGLIESGMLALDNSCGHMERQFAPGNHGDFFTWPIMLAIKNFESFAEPSRMEEWKRKARDLDPQKFYAFYNQYHINWNLVHASGEFLRYKEGFTDLNYVDTCLLMQMDHFTDYGMYNEWGNPLAYDLFSRQYLTGVFDQGYEGKHREVYMEILWKGAWMSLFMQSPTGELPTGYRSSHHIWNEAEQAMIFEYYAKQYSQAGLERLAGAFKRGAMLSLQNIKGWIRPDGSGYIVKNKFPIEEKHGYERYSVHTCYNMLATSMLAQAYQFAEDIEEQICPADIGGYVIPVLKPFHKIFASLNGTYLEYDTRGDQEYNPTGILRIHLKGAIPQLGPSDGIAALWNEEGTSIALGPSWQDTDGNWTSLASQTIEPETVEILEESPDRVAFRIKYLTADAVRIMETISIQDGMVTVRDSIGGHTGKNRLSWPILVHDGKDETETQIGPNSILLLRNDVGIQLNIDDRECSIELGDEEYNHRNGIARVGKIEFSGNVITYTLSPYR